MVDDPLLSVDPAVIGDRLAVARRARGLTQQQAAEALGIGRTTITAMEKGERRPRAEELYALAQLYGRQIGDLVRSGSPGESPGFVVQFRAARRDESSANGSKREADIQRFEDFCRWYVELETLLAAPLARRYPEEYDIAGANPERTAEVIAAAERNRLGLGDGPIGDLWGILETDVGLRIFAFPMQDRRISGMFVASAELGGCIAINANHPRERQRMTLAHEYWHFLTDRYKAEITVLQGGKTPQQEWDAGAFARNFLMPETGLVRRYVATKQAKQGPMTPADILTLAHLYGVSAEAMTLRLEELSLLKTGTWVSLKRQGFKPDTAKKLLDLLSSPHADCTLPYRYETLAIRAFDEAQISEGQLARMLATDRVTAARLAMERSIDSQPGEDGAWSQMSIDLGQPLVEPA